MFIDKDKVDVIDILFNDGIFNHFRNDLKFSFDPLFPDIFITTYEEALMTDFIYYYLRHNNIEDLQCYYSNMIDDKIPKPRFITFVNKDIINNNLFNNENIKAEIFGALLLNILFYLMCFRFKSNYNNTNSELFDFGNIDYIKIISGINFNNLLDEQYSLNHKKGMINNDKYIDFSLIYKYDLFKWHAINDNDAKKLGHIAFKSIYNESILSKLKSNKYYIFAAYPYNLIHMNLYDHGSIIFDIFKNDFLIYIKYYNSSNLIISNLRSIYYEKYELDISSNIKILKYNDSINLDDFIVEHNYYNLNKPSEQINSNIFITINSKQLFKYYDTIKPWARKNIYPKINNIYEYRYSGISSIQHLYTPAYPQYSDYTSYLNTLK